MFQSTEEIILFSIFTHRFFIQKIIRAAETFYLCDRERGGLTKANVR